MKILLILLSISLLSVQSAFSGALQDHQFETNFDVLYESDDDFKVVWNHRRMALYY